MLVLPRAVQCDAVLHVQRLHTLGGKDGHRGSNAGVLAFLQLAACSHISQSSALCSKGCVEGAHLYVSTMSTVHGSCFLPASCHGPYECLLYINVNIHHRSACCRLAHFSQAAHFTCLRYCKHSNSSSTCALPAPADGVRAVVRPLWWQLLQA